MINSNLNAPHPQGPPLGEAKVSSEASEQSSSSESATPQDALDETSQGASAEHTRTDDSLLPPESSPEPHSLEPHSRALSASEEAALSGIEATDLAFQDEARETLEPLLGQTVSSPLISPTSSTLASPMPVSATLNTSPHPQGAPALGIESASQASPAVSLTPLPLMPEHTSEPLLERASSESVAPPQRHEGDSGTDWLSTPAPITSTHPLTSAHAPTSQQSASQPPSSAVTASASHPSSAPPSVQGSLPPVDAKQPSQEPSGAPVEQGVEEEGALEIALTPPPDLRPLELRNHKRLEAFVNTLERARGSNVLIVLKGHPDPDSLGSAAAQQHCFKHFDIQSSIIYFDEISHPENRALVKVIEMDLTLYHEEFDFTAYDYLAFVDSQSADIPQANGVTLPPILTFVDHHKDLGKVEAEFIDIRETYGSTSAIYAEYLEYYPAFSLQKSSSIDAHIATALMHGIRTDTDNLMLAGPSDFYAAGYLRSFIDRDLLRMVSKQSVSARTMEIIKQGLNNKVIKGTFLLAGVGFVREEDRDGIAQTADFLLRHEGVETAVVFGIVNNKMVDGSLRTSSATVDPDRWLKDLFGHDEHGKHYGGGRRNKGGFRIPLGLLSMSPDRKALWKLGEQTIHDLIFYKIGEKEKDAQES